MALVEPGEGEVGPAEVPADVQHLRPPPGGDAEVRAAAVRGEGGGRQTQPVQLGEAGGREGAVIGLNIIAREVAGGRFAVHVRSAGAGTLCAGTVPSAAVSSVDSDSSPSSPP